MVRGQKGEEDRGRKRRKVGRKTGREAGTLPTKLQSPHSSCQRVHCAHNSSYALWPQTPCDYIKLSVFLEETGLSTLKVQNHRGPSLCSYWRSLKKRCSAFPAVDLENAQFPDLNKCTLFLMSSAMRAPSATCENLSTGVCQPILEWVTARLTVKGRSCGHP